MRNEANITVYGRDVLVRRRVWFGPFHCQMYEVCDDLGGVPYTPFAAFYGIDDVWKYITAEGHRVRNVKALLLMTSEAYRLSQEIENSIRNGNNGNRM